MRRALALAALGLMGLAGPASAVPPRRSFVLPEGVAGRPALLGDSLYYVATTRRLTSVKRLDLNTLQTTTLYSKATRSWALGPVRAGGGRIAVEVDDTNPRGGLSSQVLELFPAGGAPRTVARGLVRAARRQSCGTEVVLEDVSPEGELLVDQSRMRCRSRAMPRHELRRYGTGPPAVVRRYVERPSDEVRERRLVAGRVLETTTSSVTLGGRRIHSAGRGHQILGADLDPAADVAIGEIRLRGRSTRSLVRLLTPTGSRVLLDAPGTQAEPRFCGSRLLIQSVSSQALQLLVYDDLAGAPRTAFASARDNRDLELNVVCDADTAVLADLQTPRRTAIQVVPLAP